jgi:hypothetical protein
MGPRWAGAGLASGLTQKKKRREEENRKWADWRMRPKKLFGIRNPVSFFLGLFQNQIEFNFERFPHESKTKTLNQIKTKCKRHEMQQASLKPKLI